MHSSFGEVIWKYTYIFFKKTSLFLLVASGGSYRKSWLAKFFTNYEPHVVLCVPSAHETSVVDALNELISGVLNSFSFFSFFKF